MLSAHFHDELIRFEPGKPEQSGADAGGLWMIDNGVAASLTETDATDKYAGGDCGMSLAGALR
jgi:hypothetical protein